MAIGHPLEGEPSPSLVRLGDRIHRPPGPDPEYLRQVLIHLVHSGWSGAPEFLGTDVLGREVFTWIEGHVAVGWPQPAEVLGEPSLARAALLVRQFHDLTAGTSLARDQEVVCHNDVAPRNTVYRDLGEGLRPVAFIDWDLAAPGRRIDDVAFMCWQFLYLGTRCLDVDVACRGIEVLCDSYGLENRSGLGYAVVEQMNRTMTGLMTAAEDGDEQARDRIRRGALDMLGEARAWMLSKTDELTRRLA